MKKEILYEINEIRVKMGLKILEESSILLVEASPIVTYMEKFILRSGIRDTEKFLIKKFLSPSVNGALTEIEKGELKTFLKTVEGTNFLGKLESAIANEQDDAIKLRMQGWVDNNLRRFADAPVTQRTGKGSITGGGQGSHNLMPDPNPLHIPNPTEITDASIDEIVKTNLKNPRFQEYMVMLDNLHLSSKIKDLMIVSYSHVGADANKAIKYATELTKNLNEKEYGWLKRQVNKAAKDPSRAISVGGKTIASATFWYTVSFAVLSLGAIGVAWLRYFQNTLPKPPSSSTSNNLIPDAEKWLKDNGYWSDGMKLTSTNDPNEVIWKLNGQQNSIYRQNDGSFK